MNWTFVNWAQNGGFYLQIVIFMSQISFSFSQILDDIFQELFIVLLVDVKVGKYVNGPNHRNFAATAFKSMARCN